MTATEIVAHEAAKIKLGDEDREVLLTAVATAYRDPTPAEDILRRIGVPADRSPTWNSQSSRLWWTQAFDELDKGLAPDWHVLLLHHFRKDYPWNEQVLRLAEKYKVGDDGRTASVSGIAAMTAVDVGASGVEDLGDPIDDLVFAEILCYLKEWPPDSVLFSNDVEEAVEAQGVSAEEFRESMNALIDRKLVEATPMIDRQRWLLLGVPSQLWLEEEARTGIDVDEARRTILGAVISGEESIELATFAGLHWRTNAAILDEFHHNGLLKWVQAHGGIAIVKHVSPLARRTLRTMGAGDSSDRPVT